ncbi:hypothetical protein IOQ60_001957, partial [Listeria monocytogenes]|nr:hypothetical protein [Listeria monocytogenes]
MVKVAKVEWTDESQQEADVTISDGAYSVVCFSCPFSLKEDDIFMDVLYCLDVENIQKSNEPQQLVIKKDDFYEYFLRGKLEDKENKIVRIGELCINISEAYIPGDIREGDMIEFT